MYAMIQKLSWLTSLVLAAAVGAGVMRWVAPAAPAGTVGSDPALIERLERLEAAMPGVQGSLARTGAQLGALALVTKASSQPAARPPEPSEEQQERQAAERAARESDYYDQLDTVARRGGVAATDPAAAKLRQNLEALRALPKEQVGALDIRALDCSQAVCRLEIRTSGGNPSTLMAIEHTLGRGMGGLSMRPLTGGPAIYYVAAPGHRLPAMTF